jgi:hypothetical protein
MADEASRLRRLLVFAGSVALGLLVTSPARAGQLVTFNIDHAAANMPGDKAQLGYLTATFADEVDSKGKVVDVLLTISSFLTKGELIAGKIVGAQNVSGINFDFGPNTGTLLDPRHLNFAARATDKYTKGAQFSTSAPNGQPSIAAGQFDLTLSWDPKLGALAGGTAVSYKITDSIDKGFDAAFFDFPSLWVTRKTSFDTSYYAAAHVQGITGQKDSKGHAYTSTGFVSSAGIVTTIHHVPLTPTPAPGALVLVATAVGPLAVWRRWRGRAPQVTSAA